MIYIKDLTYEERATFGTCPICEAQHGEPCDVMPEDVEGFQPFNELGGGAHAARLINAPKTAAVDDGAQNG